MKILRSHPDLFSRFPIPVSPALSHAVGLAWALSGLLACTPNAQPGTCRLRLYVGEIKEVALRSPADTSAQLLAVSENKEVVDISRQEAVHQQPTALPTRLVFLLKGVTAGKARVVFSEKPAGSLVPERTRKFYLVEVVNK